MAKAKCPDCKRDSTYNAKFDQCSGCGRGYKPVPTTGASPFKPVSEPRESRDTPARTGVATGGSEPATRRAAELEPGKPCPACGKPVGKSKAQLQKEYRERKKR